MHTCPRRYPAAVENARNSAADEDFRNDSRAWLAWGFGKDAPRVFCPNAELFDEISAACRRDGHVSQEMESEGRGS